MPTTLPRIAIVLAPEQHRLLMRLSALQGRSAASYVRHLVDMATPSLRAILEPLERLRAEEESMDENLQAALAEMLAEADDELDDQLAFGEWVLDADGDSASWDRPRSDNDDGDRAEA